MPNVGILTDTAVRDTGETFKEITGTDIANKRCADISAKLAGNDIREADDIDVSLGNLTYTAKDQMGNDSYEYTNAVQANGGKSELVYCRLESSIGGANALDLDILIADAAITTTSSDGVAWDATQANQAKILQVLEIREHHYPPDLGTLDLIALLPPDELGQFLQAASGSTSFHIGFIWRGVDKAVGVSEALKLRLGFKYVD